MCNQNWILYSGALKGTGTYKNILVSQKFPYTIHRYHTENCKLTKVYHHKQILFNPKKRKKKINNNIKRKLDALKRNFSLIPLFENRRLPPCLLIHGMALELLEWAEANSWLGNAAVHEDREAAVEAGHPPLTHCLPRTVHNTLVLPQLRAKK